MKRARADSVKRPPRNRHLYDSLPLAKRMRIRDPKAIKAARKEACEWCKRWGLTEVHHVIARGMGGAHGDDVPENLIALCRVCHFATHAGHISKADLYEVINRRSEW